MEPCRWVGVTWASTGTRLKRRRIWTGWRRKGCYYRTFTLQTHCVLRVSLSNMFLPAATKLGQGNIFTPVCDSVNRGGTWSGSEGGVPGLVPGGVPGLVTGGYLVWSRGYLADPPPQQTPPLGPDPPRPDTPPGADLPPRADTPRSRHLPRGRHPLRSRHPSRADTPRSRHPPEQQTSEYGLRAAGTHPTGMHSCSVILFQLKEFNLITKVYVLFLFNQRQSNLFCIFFFLIQRCFFQRGRPYCQDDCQSETVSTQRTRRPETVRTLYIVAKHFLAL